MENFLPPKIGFPRITWENIRNLEEIKFLVGEKKWIIPVKEFFQAVKIVKWKQNETKNLVWVKIYILRERWRRSGKKRNLNEISFEKKATPPLDDDDDDDNNNNSTVNGNWERERTFFFWVVVYKWGYLGRKTCEKWKSVI